MRNLILISMFAAVLVAGALGMDYSVPGAFNGKTLELWKMDTYNGTAARINGESGDNALWMMLYDADGNPPLTELDFTELIDGPKTTFNTALSFADNTGLGDTDPVGAYAKTRLAAWEAFPYVQVGMWVKVTELNRLQFVASVASSWRIWVNNGTLYFLTFFNDGSNSGNRTVDINGYQDQWLYLTATFDENGQQSLNVRNIDGTFDQTSSADFAGKVLGESTAQIVIASDGGVRRHFSGAIDQLRIVRPEIVLDFEVPAEDTFVGTTGLWHFDSETNGIVPDDNSNDIAGRDLPLELKSTAALVTPAEYPAENSDFASCVEFDGMGAHAATAVVPTIDTSVFNVEFWLKLNPGNLPGPNQIISTPQWLAQAGTAFRIYLNINETVVNLQFRVDPITENYISSDIAVDGKWNHYKFSFDNGQMSIYENGGMIANTTANVTSVPAPTAKLYVGADGGVRRFLWGWMDDLRIYGNTDVQCGDLGYLPADINEDCYVDILDLKLVVSNWLGCTFEGDPDCENLN